MMTRIFSLMLVMLAPSSAFADAPNLQTPSPVIYLVDNLDEADQLGWCIDTQGRGFGELLHAHSCKPRGGDVQFAFDAETGLIRSVAFPDFCMVHDPSKASPMGLVPCDAAVPSQAFAFDAEAGEITLRGNAALCLAVGEASRSAGPFMSRALDMVPCSEAPDLLKSWNVLP